MPLYLGSTEGAETMKDGHADGAHRPDPASLLHIRGADQRRQGVSDPPGAGYHRRHVRARRSLLSFLLSRCDPADTYKNQTEELPTFATGTYLCCRADLSEELIYEMTKYMWENIERLNTLHAAVADLTIDAVKDIEGMPIHPGALKYYQEQGVL